MLLNALVTELQRRRSLLTNPPVTNAGYYSMAMEVVRSLNDTELLALYLTDNSLLRSYGPTRWSLADNLRAALEIPVADKVSNIAKLQDSQSHNKGK